MSVTDVSPDELGASLNGYDEIAIHEHFGLTAWQFEENPTLALRALIFVHRRREGDKDVAAKKFAMDLQLSEAYSYFAVNEPMPTDPITESGKDSPASD